MENIGNFLFSVEKKRQLYIGEGDLMALKHFIDGFCVCAQIHKIEYGESALRAFSHFVCNAYHEKRSISLYRCIMEHTCSKEEAFERYFELLHLFFDRT